MSIEVRRLRAEALVRLGRAMHAEAETFKAKHKDEKVDPVRRMEAAFIRQVCSPPVGVRSGRGGV